MGLFDLLGKKSEKEIKNLFSDMEKKIKDAVKDGFKDGIKDEPPKPEPKPAQTSPAPAESPETAAISFEQALQCTPPMRVAPAGRW